MNAQNLLRMIRNNEKANDFSIGDWNCGTYGCLFGNDMIQEKRMHLISIFFDNIQIYKSISQEYDISLIETIFLFGPNNIQKDLYGMRFISTHLNLIGIVPGEKRNNNKKECLDRVRKYLYYKLHKQEMMYENAGPFKGCIKESLRKQEGDHFVIKKVKQKIKSQLYEVNCSEN